MKKLTFILILLISIITSCKKEHISIIPNTSTPSFILTYTCSSNDFCYINYIDTLENYVSIIKEANIDWDTSFVISKLFDSKIYINTPIDKEITLNVYINDILIYNKYNVTEISFIKTLYYVDYLQKPTIYYGNSTLYYNL